MDVSFCMFGIRRAERPVNTPENRSVGRDCRAGRGPGIDEEDYIRRALIEGTSEGNRSRAEARTTLQRSWRQICSDLASAKLNPFRFIRPDDSLISSPGTCFRDFKSGLASD